MDGVSSDLISRLRDYCAKKTGSVASITFGENQPSYHVLGGFLDSFATFRLDETPIILNLRCSIDLLNKFNLKKSTHYHWDTMGWEWVDVPLNGDISESQLYELIDVSYQSVYEGLSHRQRSQIEFWNYPMTPYEVIDYLIEEYNLSHGKRDILSFLSIHIVLKTKIADENSLAIGQSKMGGSPDLPDGWEIPKYNGKWLEFLAQVNLSEIPIEMRDSPLPKTGMLYFFSAFAWHEPADINSLMEFWGGEQEGCSRVLYFDGDIRQLKRHSRLPDDYMINPRSIKFDLMLSFHDEYYEIIRKELLWDETDWEKIFDLMIDYRELIDYRPQHKLLGYAQWIQGRYAPKEMRLLFQLDSEGDDMMWGDSGKIYFMIRPEDLINRNFSSIYSEFQCH